MSILYALAMLLSLVVQNASIQTKIPHLSQRQLCSKGRVVNRQIGKVVVRCIVPACVAPTSFAQNEKTAIEKRIEAALTSLYTFSGCCSSLFLSVKSCALPSSESPTLNLVKSPGFLLPLGMKKTLCGRVAVRIAKMRISKTKLNT